MGDAINMYTWTGYILIWNDIPGYVSHKKWAVLEPCLNIKEVEKMAKDNFCIVNGKGVQIK